MSVTRIRVEEGKPQNTPSRALAPRLKAYPAKLLFTQQTGNGTRRVYVLATESVLRMGSPRRQPLSGVTASWRISLLFGRIIYNLKLLEQL